MVFKLSKLSKAQLREYSLFFLDHTKREQSFHSAGIIAELQSSFPNHIREKLVYWMIELIVHLNFSSQIKYNALFYADIFLSRYSSFPLHKLELLGIICIFVALKLEERIKVKITHITHLCASSYQEEEIYEMEGELLRALRWKLVYPNFAELVKVMMHSFIKEPSESIIQHIEEILDFCISKYEFLSLDKISMVSGCIYIYMNEIGSMIGKNALLNLIQSIEEFNTKDFDTCILMLAEYMDNLLTSSDTSSSLFEEEEEPPRKKIAAN